MGQDILAAAIHSPFARLRTLLDPHKPGAPLIDLSIGEPKHPFPPFMMEELAKASAGFGKYPPINGTPELRGAIADWIGRRYNVSGKIDPDLHVLPLNGSREGLVNAIFPAVDRREKIDRPAVLMPNPFYQAYLAAALAAGAEPVLLDAHEETGFLPDLDALEARPKILNRTVAFYLCSPANPQGAVADAAYLQRALSLARKHNFVLLMDECYSEIYSDRPPAGAIEIALSRTDSLDNLIVLNSLSKRSSVPGLRSGFCAGDPAFLKRFSQFRNVAAPQVPLPIQAASTALWRDETHVEANRALYQAKFDAAAAILGNRFGSVRPAGGFFLWLKMTQFGGGEAAAVTLWQHAGVKVVPGAYLTMRVGEGMDPGSAYIRIALVQDLLTTREALVRVVSCFE
jgi:N-succinyldiaminopimelate aminotransferase